MSTATPNQARLQSSTQELCEVLERLQDHQEGLLVLLSEQEKALVEVLTEELDTLREREEQVLRRIIDEEKERMLITEEVGDLLDHDEPASIRVAEILPHLPGELASRLTECRDELRHVALRLSRQNALNRALIEHSVGHIQIFMSRLAFERQGGPQYDDTGTTPDAEGDSFLMDRRG